MRRQFSRGKVLAQVAPFTQHLHEGRPKVQAHSKSNMYKETMLCRVTDLVTVSICCSSGLWYGRWASVTKLMAGTWSCRVADSLSLFVVLLFLVGEAP